MGLRVMSRTFGFFPQTHTGKLGGPVYLVTDCLENKRHLPLTDAAWTGSLEALAETLESLE